MPYPPVVLEPLRRSIGTSVAPGSVCRSPWYEEALPPDVAWDVVLLDSVAAWYEGLLRDDPESHALVAAALDVLADRGPSLGRPLVDTLRGSNLSNLKELRPGSRRRSELRLLFVFDPTRRAVVLVAGDKSGSWRGWYRTNIPVAVRRYQAWLEGDSDS